MEFIQQIKLKSVTANDNAILFKVNVNGEDRIFIGQQDTNFNIAIQPNLKSSNLSSKLSSKLKLAESFQKAYIIDRHNINRNDIKKDVIIPCAVSQDIVQFGNYMYSMSKETNDSVLYLMYKNRLFDRYVDDETKMIYYEINSDKLKDFVLKPEEILNGSDTGDFKGLINNFNYDITTDKNGINTTTNTVKAVEIIKEYLKLEGKDAEIIQTSESSENLMPFNLIYEYGDEEQYENNDSNLFVDFIHLKNSLSPFFNVSVDNENRFNLWRKYVTIKSDNITFWSSYTLDIPKKVTESNNSDAPVFNVGNASDYVIANKPNAFFDDVYSFATFEDGAYNTNIPDNLNAQGFSIHIDCETREIKDRYFYSFNTRKNALLNKERNYLNETGEDFIDWVVSNSTNNEIDFAYNYNNSDYIKFWVQHNSFGQEFAEGGNIEFICKQNAYDKFDTADDDTTDDTKWAGNNIITVKEPLKYLLPHKLNVFNFNYDSISFSRKNYQTFNVYDPNIKIKLDNGGNELINWESINANSACIYKCQYELIYDDDSTDSFNHLKSNEADLSCKQVVSNGWAKEKGWTIELYKPSDKVIDTFITYFNYNNYQVGRDLDTNDNTGKITLIDVDFGSNWETIKNEYLNGTRFIDIDKIELNYAQHGFAYYDAIVNKIKFNTINAALGFIFWNILNAGRSAEEVGDGTVTPEKLTLPHTNNAGPSEDLLGSHGYTANAVLNAFDYYARRKYIWHKDDKITITNYRTACYNLTDFASDKINCENEYYSETNGPSIRFLANPFDIRHPIGAFNPIWQFDPSINEFYSNSHNISIIDLLTLSINGKYLKNYNMVDSNIIGILKDYNAEVCSVDLSVSFKDYYQNDKLIINLFINGNHVIKHEYDKDSFQYSFLKQTVTDSKAIRFWSYSNIDDYITPFNYNNIAMWNYPINQSQAQQMYRLIMDKENITDYTNELFVIEDSQFTAINNIDEALDKSKIYGKLFAINNVLYKYDYDTLKDSNDLNLKRLYMVKDFEFIDRIDGINKIIPDSTTKSNLYSVRLNNTALVIEDYDDEQTIKFKNTVNAALRSAISEICSKVEPINTRLYSIMIES